MSEHIGGVDAIAQRGGRGDTQAITEEGKAVLVLITCHVIVFMTLTNHHSSIFCRIVL